MSNRLILVAAAVGAVVLIKRRGGLDFEKLIEGMPDDAPPKWMFHNISAIRANTDRILELAEAERQTPEHAAT